MHLWCNGSMTVSKTVGMGSIPIRCACYKIAKIYGLVFGFDRGIKYLNAFVIDKSRYDYQLINLTDNRMLAVA